MDRRNNRYRHIYKWSKRINITKEIELVFTNVDTTADNIQNRIGAKINLDTTSTEEETEEGEIQYQQTLK